MRHLLRLLALALGVLAGALMAGCGDASSVADRNSATTVTEPPAAPTSTPSAPASNTTDSGDSTTSTVAPSSEAAQLAWVFVPSGLTPEVRQAAEDLAGVQRLAQVDVAAIDMVSSVSATGRDVDSLSDGFRIQMDARAYGDVADLAELAPETAAAVADLDADEVLLSAGSAELRRLDVGGTITFVSGETVTVAAIVGEELVGSAEVVFANPEALEAAGAVSIRPGLLVDFDGQATALEAHLLEANGGTGVRVFNGRGSEERQALTPVLTPLAVKQQFGEFSFRPSGGRSVEIDEEWFDENIVLRRVPLIGRMRCHRVFIDALTEVMAGLAKDGMADMIDVSAYQGCWTPRFIGGSKRLSRHSWGIAADINFGNDLDYSVGSPVHPILLNRMAEAGLISGHGWVNADPGHFEYVGQTASR